MAQKIVTQKGIDTLINDHQVFNEIYRLYGSPSNWERPEGFVTLCRLILEQQVSLASAAAHFKRLSDRIELISPENILSLTDDELRACCISRQKSTYLRALSVAVQSGALDLDGLSKLPVEKIRAQLLAIKGIGNWTTDVYLLFCLPHPDIFPIGDVALVNAACELTGLKTKEEILMMSENWRPYLSLATYFFWHYYLKKRNREAMM